MLVSSRVGRAVTTAAAKARGTVDAAEVASQGRIEDVWRNDGGHADLCMREVCKLIRAARHEVCIQSYIVDCTSDAFNELAAALAAKQRESPDFKVYFVTTSVQHASLPWRLRAQNLRLSYVLEQRGIKAQVADFVNPIASRQSDHAKSFLIDGVTAVIGGDNIDNKHEKDLMVRVTGPVVDALLHDFDHAWTSAYARKDGLARGADAAPVHRRGRAAASDKPLVPMAVLSKQGQFTLGRFYANAADQALLTAIRNARTEIKIASPNFNDMLVMEAIEDAARRGVRVRIMLPKGYLETASSLDRGSNTDFAQWVAQRPARVASQLDLRWCERDNHTKYVSVDGLWCYVGSQNMDNQAWRYSRELGLGIDDPEQVRRLDARAFDADFRRAKPVRSRLWDRLVPAISPIRRLIEAIVRLFTG